MAYSCLIRVRSHLGLSLIIYEIYRRFYLTINRAIPKQALVFSTAKSRRRCLALLERFNWLSNEKKSLSAAATWCTIVSCTVSLWISFVQAHDLFLKHFSIPAAHSAQQDRKRVFLQGIAKCIASSSRLMDSTYVSLIYRRLIHLKTQCIQKSHKLWVLLLEQLLRYASK